MNKYNQEIKQRIDSIREKYSSTADVIFRAAIAFVFEVGAKNLPGEAYFKQIELQNTPSDGEMPDIERKILNCARELAQVEIIPLLAYIQREIYFGSDGLSYRRAIDLLRRCIECIDEHHDDCSAVLIDLRYSGFCDAEINELGFGYLLDLEEEE